MVLLSISCSKLQSSIGNLVWLFDSGKSIVSGEGKLKAFWRVLLVSFQWEIFYVLVHQKYPHQINHIAQVRIERDLIRCGLEMMPMIGHVSLEIYICSSLEYHWKFDLSAQHLNESRKLGWGTGIQHSVKLNKNMSCWQKSSWNKLRNKFSWSFQNWYFIYMGAHVEFVTNVTDGTHVCIRTLQNAQQIKGIGYFDSFNTL